MKFSSLSASGQEPLSLLLHAQQAANPYIAFLLDRAKACNLELVLITPAEPDRALVEQSGLDGDLISHLRQAWAAIHQPDQTSQPAVELARRVLEEHTLPLVNPAYEKNFLLRRLRADRRSNRALLFLEAESAFPWTAVIMLTNAHQVTRDRIPLHASAVIYQGALYLLGGPSGAGKSSAAHIIVAQGGQLLDEDQVLLRKTVGGGYAADAWRYSLQTCAAPIRAIFQLEQDQADAVQRLSPRQAAAFLMGQSHQAAGWMLTDQLYQQLFSNVAELARQIPAYRLHFKLSPGFWSLIQEELHGIPS